MRSELVFRALVAMTGRYQLCRLTAKASRKLHTPKNRMQDTLNDVLLFISRSTATANGELIGVKQRRRESAPTNTPGIEEVAQIRHLLPQLELGDARGSLSADRLDRKNFVFESHFQMLRSLRNGVEEHA